MNRTADLNPMYAVCDRALLKKAFARLKKRAEQADNDSFTILDRLDEACEEKNRAVAEELKQRRLLDAYRVRLDEALSVAKHFQEQCESLVRQLELREKRDRIINDVSNATSEQWTSRSDRLGDSGIAGVDDKDDDDDA